MSKETIIERHSIETEPGIKKLDLVNILLELEARIKNINATLEEIKQVIQGQAKWAEIVDMRLKKLEPQIQIVTEAEAKIILKK